jgi:MFS transporter, DHA1 family, multidrug resistance protein
MMSDASVHDPEASRGQSSAPRLSLALIVAITAVPSISINIFLPSIPGLAIYFRTDIPTVHYGLSLYLLGLAFGQLAYGPLSDRLGRRPVLLTGIGIYCIGSAICAFAPDIRYFLLGRMLQATGGCAGIVLGRAMLRDVHERGRVASMLGYTVMITTLATAIAPIIGGVLEGLFGWRAPFLFLTIVGVAVWIACLLWGKETIGAKVAAGHFWSSYAAVIGYRVFWRFALFSSFLMGSFYVFVAGAPVIIIDLWGYPPTAFGAWWMIGSAAYFAGNYLAGRFSERFGCERMLRIGNPVILIGAAAFAIMLMSGPRHPLAVFLPIGIVFIGSGMVQPSAMSGAINVGEGGVGAASGLLGCLQIICGIASISLLGLLPLDEPGFFGLLCAGLLVAAIVSGLVLRRDRELLGA